MKENLDCVQRGSGDTGKSWLQTQHAITKHHATEITMECVQQLDQKASDSAVSDAQYITNWLRNDAGFGFAEHHIGNASQYGSPVPRTRLWWTGIRDVAASSQQCAAHLSEML
eukprot:8205301-Karenia_brevis.AAC.1